MQGDRLAIAVRDQGMGIPAAEQKSIFHKFVRGANSREAGIKGAGLGLAMVKHIVAAHGGEIRLESAQGEGEPVHDPDSPGEGSMMRILVVEDEPPSRSDWKRI